MRGQASEGEQSREVAATWKDSAPCNGCQVGKAEDSVPCNGCVTRTALGIGQETGAACPAGSDGCSMMAAARGTGSMLAAA